MTTHDELMDDGEWTAEDRAHLAALPAERMPSEQVKRRTIEAARLAGYVRPASRGKAVRAVALLAAAGLIFVAGTIMGYLVARHGLPTPSAARSRSDVTVANARSFTLTVEQRGNVVWY